MAAAKVKLVLFGEGAQSEAGRLIGCVGVCLAIWSLWCVIDQENRLAEDGGWRRMGVLWMLPVGAARGVAAEGSDAGVELRCDAVGSGSLEPPRRYYSQGIGHY